MFHMTFQTTHFRVQRSSLSHMFYDILMTFATVRFEQWNGLNLGQTPRSTKQDH
jgi:hypothetical protein